MLEPKNTTKAIDDAPVNTTVPEVVFSSPTAHHAAKLEKPELDEKIDSILHKKAELDKELAELTDRRNKLDRIINW